MQFIPNCSSFKFVYIKLHVSCNLWQNFFILKQFILHKCSKQGPPAAVFTLSLDLNMELTLMVEMFKTLQLALLKPISFILKTEFDHSQSYRYLRLSIKCGHYMICSNVFIHRIISLSPPFCCSFLVLVIVLFWQYSLRRDLIYRYTCTQGTICHKYLIY